MDINGLEYQCPECGELNYPALTEEKANIDDTELILSVLTCPHCGDEIVVQLDDRNTEKLVRRQINLYVRSALLPSDRLFEKLSEISALLVRRRNELNLQYNGRVYYLHGKKKKISFNVPNMKIKSGGNE